MEYSNPGYADADGLVIDCTLTLPGGERVPFTVRADHPETAALYAEIKRGAVPIEPYSPPILRAGAAPRKIA